jgi:alpha-tubulin suppressor-like RCC1 family protein
MGLSGVIAISAGGGNSLALRADGKVIAWGADGYGQGSVPGELRGHCDRGGSTSQLGAEI